MTNRIFSIVDNDTWMDEAGNVIIRTYLTGRSTAAKYTLHRADGKIQDYRSLKGAKGEIWGEERKMKCKR